jgi:hypothetical protein
LRRPFWRTFLSIAWHNPPALKTMVFQVAAYLYLGPFSERVIREIDQRIAELAREPRRHYPALAGAAPAA